MSHKPTTKEFKKLRKDARSLLVLLLVRSDYQDEWVWGAGAEYLFRKMIEILGLEKYEDQLIRLARRKRGRKRETALASRIWSLKADGRTSPQIKAIFESEGQHFSLEKIESYLKTRRRKPSGNPHVWKLGG